MALQRSTFLVVAALAALIATSVSTSQFKVANLHILQASSLFSLENVKNVPQIVNSGDVAGILGHFFGVKSSFALPRVSLPNSKDEFSSPNGHLVVVVEGAEFNDKLFDSVLQYEIVSPKTYGHDALLSHLMSGSDINSKSVQMEPASVQDAVAELLNGQSLVLSVSSSENLGDIVSLHKELLVQHPEWNSFSVILNQKVTNIENGLLKTLKSGLEVASLDILSSIRNPDGTTFFDFNNPAVRQFGQELSALSALVPLLSSDAALNALVADNHPDLITFVISGLQQIRSSYGESSLEYRTAWAKLNAIIPQVARSFSTLYNDKATSSVLLLDYEEPSSSKASKLSLNRQTRAPSSGAVPLYTCYDSEEACMQSTSNCSSVALCGVYKMDASNVCYRCLCGPDYTGESCEYQDVSAMFWIMAFIVISLLVALIFVSTVLAYMDPGTNTLLFRTGQVSRQKIE